LRHTNFLFHVPGAKTLSERYDNEPTVDSNWVDIDTLKEIHHKPVYVEVRDFKRNHSFGRMPVMAAIAKFA
jgi:hypothetical protein